MNAEAPLFIEGIEVKGLFGVYDYKLGGAGSGRDTKQVVILYGDNGSGKTTILRTLFHLLAPNDDSGHKSAVGRTAFERFAVRLSNSVEVVAERPKGQVRGDFRLRIKHSGKKAREFWFPVSPESIVDTKTLTEAQILAIAECLSLLQELNLGLYHLADDRTIKVAGKAVVDLSHGQLATYEDADIAAAAGMLKNGGRASRRSPGNLAAILLAQSILRFNSWITNQLIRASSLGDSNVNTLYNEILGASHELRGKTGHSTKIRQQSDHEPPNSRNDQGQWRSTGLHRNSTAGKSCDRSTPPSVLESLT